MGLADAFGAEDRVSVKFSDFYNMMREAAIAELVQNAVICDVPNEYIFNMITGQRTITEETEKDG